MALRRRALVPAFFLIVLGAACGGAIDNELNQKTGSSGSSGTSVTPTATASPTSTPPSQPTTQPAPNPTPPPNGKCDVRFKQDVLDVFAKTGCGNEQCHGGSSPRNPPAIDPTNPPLTYKSMINFTLSTGKPYVVPGNTDPNASALSCNLHGTCGVPMPIPGPLTTAQLDLVDAWLACGAPFEN